MRGMGLHLEETVKSYIPDTMPLSLTEDFVKEIDEFLQTYLSHAFALVQRGSHPKYIRACPERVADAFHTVFRAVRSRETVGVLIRGSGSFLEIKLSFDTSLLSEDEYERLLLAHRTPDFRILRSHRFIKLRIAAFNSAVISVYAGIDRIFLRALLDAFGEDIKGKI